MAVTAVASATSSTALLAAGSRRSAIIENSDANRLYVLLDGGTASATNYSFSLAANENASIPSAYTGPVNGIWAADGTGYAQITTY
jgi:hypothetical protein